MAGEVEDLTAQDVTDKGQQTTEETSAAEETSGAEGQAATETEIDAGVQALDSILDKYQLDSPEALDDFIGKLSTTVEKLGDEDVDELLENKETLIQYHRVWAQQEEDKKRETETPQDTIKRLEGEISKRDKADQRRRDTEKTAQENERLLKNFNATVAREIDNNKDIPKHLKSHFKTYMGIDNPIHDIDLSDRQGIKKMVAKLAKGVPDLVKSIQTGKAPDTKDTKETDMSTQQTQQTPGTPPMSKTTEAGPAEPEKKVKNLKEARAIAAQKLAESFGKPR